MLFMPKKDREAFMEQRSKEEAAAALLGVGGGAGGAGQGAGQGAGAGGGAGGGAGFAVLLAAEPPPHQVPDIGVMGGCDAEDVCPSDVDGEEKEDTGSLEACASAAAARQQGAQERAQRRTEGAATGRRKIRKLAAEGEAQAAQAEGEAEGEGGAEEEEAEAEGDPEYKKGPRSSTARPWAAHHPLVPIPTPGTLAAASDSMAQGRYLCFYCGYRRQGKRHFKDGVCKYREEWQAIMEQHGWKEAEAGKCFHDNNKKE